MSNVRREKYRNNDDIIYAELSLTNVPQSEVISKFSPSEYASIDFSKQSTITSPTSLGSEDDTIEVTCESPLVNNLKRKQWSNITKIGQINIKSLPDRVLHIIHTHQYKNFLY
ncbi:uncharacterized protein LOC111636480 [Centruroides sculpturatus]|uniref:uncharacterized protein LOC111636480 n=1 Tax=Centruroides sculpturatus TaxID=218467 RepID=UPI000C6D0FF9|nr:uncharacterized protein LOC111636480 [Centruroides sculpturatus]